MPTIVGIPEVHQLMSRGTPIVDVLPEAEYLEEHLPGAVNIPLKKLDGEAVAALDPRQPVTVYCFDYQ